MEEPQKFDGAVSEKSPNEFLNGSPSEIPIKPLLPKLTIDNGAMRSFKPSKSESHLLGPGSQKSKIFDRRRAITNEHKMKIVEVIAKERDFRVDKFSSKVMEKRDELHKNEREALRKIHSDKAIDAEIDEIKKTPTMRIPFTTGLFIPDSVTKQLNGNTGKVPEEFLINNIIKPYKWYEIDHVIIDPEDRNTIVASSKNELWWLRIGFVILIGAVISCIIYFAIFYSEKSNNADYEHQKANIVNGVKFGITAWMSLIMFACNKTTNARDSILTNHLNTAVDVVRRVEKERWCANHTPIALPMMPASDAAPTNMARLSSTA